MTPLWKQRHEFIQHQPHHPQPHHHHHRNSIITRSTPYHQTLASLPSHFLSIAVHLLPLLPSFCAERSALSLACFVPSSSTRKHISGEALPPPHTLSPHRQPSPKLSPKSHLSPWPERATMTSWYDPSFTPLIINLSPPPIPLPTTPRLHFNPNFLNPDHLLTMSSFSSYRSNCSSSVTLASVNHAVSSASAKIRSHPPLSLLSVSILRFVRSNSMASV